MNEFLSMGGYAEFVWPAVILTVGIVVWNAFTARRAHVAALEEARRRVAVRSTEAS
jgi:heme exporter protein CcmD